MPDRDDVAHWIAQLGNFRTRARARQELQRLGPDAAAARLLPLIADRNQPENLRWSAITLVRAWAYEPASAALLEVVKTHSGLRGSAVQALEVITGLAIGDFADEWDEALKDVEAYRRRNQEPDGDAVVGVAGEPDGCHLFREALGKVATEITWEPEGYLFLRLPVEGGRKQQVAVTFGETDAAGRAMTTIYTECGPLMEGSLESVNRRNVTVRCGRFYVEKDADGVEKVVMREAVPSKRLTAKLAREMVVAIATEADSLERELTGADHI